jgi:hypothetical protein
VAVSLATGCVNTLHPLIGPLTAKLDLKAADPQRYAVRINLLEGGESRPDASGRVTAEIPRFGRTCSLYFLFIPIRDGRPDRLPIIQIVENGRVVRQLSVHELSGLQLDADGYAIVRLQ